MFLFLSLSLLSFAPSTYPTGYIKESEKIVRIDKDFYDPLYEAVTIFESGKNDTLCNEREQAYGRAQIRQCRIEHYNRLTGANYTLQDMFDSKKSREVFLYFAKGKTYEQAARQWNGSGPMTIVYWMNIQNILQGNNKPKVMCYSQKEAIEYLTNLLKDNFDYTGKI
jgi:DNA-binding CsgD family transcriptional regulator